VRCLEDVQRHNEESRKGNCKVREVVVEVLGDADAAVGEERSTLVVSVG
jgi:hypothetical protein